MVCSCNSSDFECLPPEPAQGPVGPVGPQGNPGSDGSNGVNSFTFSVDEFIMPAVGNAVGVNVLNGTWPAPLQILFVQTAGFMQVLANGSTTLTLKNVGADDNAAPGATISTNRQISPAGYAGELLSPLDIVDGGTGADNSTVGFNNLSPLTTTGDTLVFESGGNVRKPLGTSGHVPVSNGITWNWQTNAPAAADITGQVAIANGGTSANTAATARTALGVPGLASSNTFTGTSNVFDVGAGAFQVIRSGINLILANSFGFKIRNTSNTPVIDVENSRGFSGYKQLYEGYATANASTYTIAAANPSAGSGETLIISTYSTTGTQAITLPAGEDTRVVRIIDGGGLAGTNPITITRAGADTILGGTTYPISLNYGTVALIYHAATTNWLILP